MTTNPNDPNVMAESHRERRERKARESYERVRDYDYKLYGDIAAFAGTLDLPGGVYEQDTLAVRARVETFCINIVGRVLDGEGL